MSKIRQRLALSLASAIFALAALGGLGPSPSLRAEDWEESQQQLEQLREDQANLTAKIEATRGQARNLEAQSQKLEEQLAELQAEEQSQQANYEKLQAELKQARAALAVALKRTDEAQAELRNQQERYEGRITSMFRIRQQSRLSILLNSESIGSFFTNIELLSYISNSDYKALQDLKTARVLAAEAQKKAQATTEDYRRYVAEKQEALEDLKAGKTSALEQQSEVAQRLLQQNQDLKNYESQQLQTTAAIEALRPLLQQQREAWLARQEQQRQASISHSQAVASYEQASREQASREQERQEQASREAASREAASREAEGGGSPATEAPTAAPTEAPEPEPLPVAPEPPPAGPQEEAMIYPLANSRTISSYFGWRPNPFGGSSTTFHWGLDFPAPAGTPVRASLSGRVIDMDNRLEGQVSGGINFGNYIEILSEDGRALIYAHLYTTNVRVGQEVRQGEVIGSVGSTGYSTGPHLHFQLMVPWSDAQGVDPLPYLP